jgi:hypothetical protein
MCWRLAVGRRADGPACPMVVGAKDPGGIPRPVAGSHPMGSVAAPKVEIIDGVVEYIGSGILVMVVAGDISGGVMSVAPI